MRTVNHDTVGVRVHESFYESYCACQRVLKIHIHQLVDPILSHHKSHTFPHLLLTTFPWVIYPPVPPPDQPTIDMDSIETTSDSIKLSWSVDEHVTYSEVKWGEDGVTTKADDSPVRVDAPDNTYTIGGLKSDTKYTITVTVVNPAGIETSSITHTTEKSKS